MKATTIKVDGSILQEIKAAKPPSVSLTAFVKELIRHELKRRKLRTAARRYASLLRENEEEKSLFEDWQGPDLVKPPIRRGASE